MLKAVAIHGTESNSFSYRVDSAAFTDKLSSNW